MSAVEVASFWVDGVPQPQGSKTAGVTKDGRPYIRDKNPAALRAWRKAIASAASFEFVGRDVLDGPVVVHVEFRFVRGKTVTREFPSVTPDIDKLARALLDGVGDAKSVWVDDSRVVTLRAHKVYADRAGAWVRIGVLEGESK
jgi:Holliday junction resolvase RusA-like endonuclease